MASWKVASVTHRSALVPASALCLLLSGRALAQPSETAQPAPTPETTAPAPASPRVVVAMPEGAPPLLREAVVRAQGELSAVGLGAEVEPLTANERATRRASHWEGDVYGVLELEQRGRWLWIFAWAPRARQSIDERVDLTAPGVTAEVIAVRAVETLRAAMLEFARRERGGVPDAVKGFTRFTPDRAPAGPATPTTGAGPPRSPPLAFWAGPAVSLHAGTSPDLGMQLGALVGRGPAFVGAAFETTLFDLALAASHGRADVRRQAVWAQLGARFRPSSRWEVATRGGGGYAAFAIEGEGEAGYRGQSAKHGSAALMLAVSSTYWATRAFGLYGSVGGRLALSAPTIVIAKKAVITLDRPSFVVSLGVNVGVF